MSQIVLITGTSLASRKLVDPSGDAYLDLMVGMMATRPKA